jgi:hypothetical protein
VEELVSHFVGVIANDAPVTIPIQRSPGVNWPGEGRCSCDECVDGFVRLVGRSRLRAV